MPRPLRPLDPSAGPIQAFAADLRKLHEEANKPKFIQMARKGGKSRTAMAEAVGGDHLPSWETVAAFVTVCGGNPAEWRIKWEQAREQVRANHKHEPDQAPAIGLERKEAHSWPPRAVPYVVTALLSMAIASGATTAVLANMDDDPPRQTLVAGGKSPGPVVVAVQNKVALGRDRLIEDIGPAYLSTKPEPFCARHGCKVPGTEVGSGAMLVAVCHIQGAEMFNYNLDSSESRTNPYRAASTLWYKAVFPRGQSGYISEVYIEQAARGGLGLPICK